MEDPNEDFTDMRDLCDLHMLRKKGIFGLIHKIERKSLIQRLTKEYTLIKVFIIIKV